MDCNFKQNIFYIVKKARLTACNILRAFHGCKINISMYLFKTYVGVYLNMLLLFTPHTILI